MNHISRDSEGIAGRRLLFTAALWTLIAVALLSALAPLGPPLSRVAGSAFNPATTDVMIKARAPIGIQAAQPERPDGDGALALNWILPAVAASLPLLWWPRAVFFFLPAQATELPSVRSGLSRARAPPALF